ncbi:hypothetical protein FOA43_002300 [Brettanomyces nanus]|uniref:Uncharacterized protein n=1 Tax=Eeniella nana TaxID=13502 RepID=A0A875RZK0_EENNA|nr:uncharacterized protein FOA43_002300 [Brettanomyces nanus]QPG74961.1 hypothetical protein FOA43_002300 [Brettanomyces nanus]
MVVESGQYDMRNECFHWKSISTGIEEKYHPDIYADNVKTLGISSKVDFVIIGAYEMTKLKVFSREVAESEFCTSDTIFLVDCTIAAGLEEEINIANCFATYFDLSTKEVKRGSTVILQYENGTTVAIGSSFLKKELNQQENILKRIIEGEGVLGANLKKLKELLKLQYIQTVHLIPPDRTPSVGSYCWKQVIPLINFQVLWIIYSSIDDKILNGVFKELVTIARSVGALEFPKPTDEGKMILQLQSMVEKYNKKTNSKYQMMNIQGSQLCNTTTDLYAEGNQEIPDAIYNFENGNGTMIRFVLSHLLFLSSKHKVKTPYLECIQSFYLKIERLKAESSFNWIRKKSTIVPVISAHPLQSSCQYPQTANNTMIGRQGWNQASAGLVSIHPRFHNDDLNSSGSSIGGKSNNTPSVQQVKNSLYGKTSASSFESYEDIARNQKSLFESANVKNLMHDTTSRYGEVDTLSQIERFVRIARRGPRVSVSSASAASTSDAVSSKIEEDASIYYSDMEE